VIVQRLAASMPSVLVANWGLWIPAQIVNFRFVPGKFQVLYSNVVALLWNVYLSYFQASKREQVE
jgi:FtsH-binding integral membrane protein